MEGNIINKMITLEIFVRRFNKIIEFKTSFNKEFARLLNLSKTTINKIKIKFLQAIKRYAIVKKILKKKLI